MMSAFAELEANLLSERTKKGLEAARARGRKGGRPSLPDHKKREIKFLYDEQKLTGEEIAKQTGVSRSPNRHTLVGLSTSLIQHITRSIYK
jgi:DNA invertase Pin-like site-specific DNA recombinase